MVSYTDVYPRNKSTEVMTSQKTFLDFSVLDTIYRCSKMKNIHSPNWVGIGSWGPEICVRVFYHVLLLKYCHENAEMQKRKFDDITLQCSMGLLFSSLLKDCFDFAEAARVSLKWSQYAKVGMYIEVAGPCLYLGPKTMNCCIGITDWTIKGSLGQDFFFLISVFIMLKHSLQVR